MPNDLNRIKELAGLQQEAEPQNTADDLISTITKLAQDAVEKSNFSDLRLFKAKEREIQELIKKEPNNKALRQIWNYYPSKETPPKKGGRFGDIDVSQAELQAQHEVIIQRLLREIINIGRKHLRLPPYLANFDKSDLTAQQQQGLAALVKKYANRKTYGGGGLIDGYLDYLAQTGVWTDAADEKEFDMALKKLGHKNLAAWEKRAQGEELEQFLGLAPITAQAQNDVEKVLGKGFQNNEELISAASDYVRSLPESAVSEAPAVAELDDKQRTASTLKYSSDPRVAYFDKMLKRYGPKLMELIIDYSHVISNNDQIKKEKLKKYGNNFAQFMDRYPQMDGVEEDFIYMLRDTVDKGEEGLISFLYDRAEQAKKSGQFSKTSRLLDPDETHDEFDRKEREKERQAQGESASQVDDTIQRARAQIETLEAALKEDYKKFQGMKPYKPKKK